MADPEKGDSPQLSVLFLKTVGEMPTAAGEPAKLFYRSIFVLFVLFADPLQ